MNRLDQRRYLLPLYRLSNFHVRDNVAMLAGADDAHDAFDCFIDADAHAALRINDASNDARHARRIAISKLKIRLTGKCLR